MAADEARAKRIRDLKAPFGREITWREIAEYVGVSERSALSWAATGAMERANALKLAEFFRGRGVEIEADYIWRGERPPTPNLIDVMKNGDDQLDRIERKIDALVRFFAGLEDAEDQEARIAALRNLAAVAIEQAPDVETPAGPRAARPPQHRAG